MSFALFPLHFHESYKSTKVYKSLYNINVIMSRNFENNFYGFTTRFTSLPGT